jgi:hypothetical protein
VREHRVAHGLDRDETADFFARRADRNRDGRLRDAAGVRQCAAARGVPEIAR